VATIDLASLGTTPDQLRELVIERICMQLMERTFVDDEGGPHVGTSEFARKLNDKVKEHVDAKMQGLAETHVLPNVSEFIEKLCLEETNKWGEKSGHKWTLTEYMVEKCDRYMLEKVDYEGKTKEQCGSYGFNGKLTRLEWMVSKFLDNRIEEAVKTWMKTAAESLGKSIEETVKGQLSVVTQKLKIAVDTGRR